MRDPGDQPVTPAVVDEEDEDLVPGVPIGKERLFEVDVRTMKVCATLVWALKVNNRG